MNIKCSLFIYFQGIKTFWGRSIVLHSETSNKRICSSFITDGSDYENFAEAKFTKGVLGSIIIRSISSSDGNSSQTLLYTNLVYPSM